jgi:hypothetical protein
MKRLSLTIDLYTFSATLDLGVDLVNLSCWVSFLIMYSNSHFVDILS